MNDNYYGHWKVWYNDGSSVRGKSLESVYGMQKIGVIAVVQVIDGTKRFMMGHDFYWPVGKEWMGGDRHGMDMYMMARGAKAVFYGMNMPTDEYQRLIKKIHADPDFPNVREAA